MPSWARQDRMMPRDENDLGDIRGDDTRYSVAMKAARAPAESVRGRGSISPARP